MRRDETWRDEATATCSVLYLANKFIEQSYEPSMPSDTSHKGLARYCVRPTRQQ